MKRCWLKEKFTEWLGKKGWEEIVSFIISGILGITFIILMFVATDRVPASPADYQQLEEIANEIKEDPGLLLEVECTVSLNDEVINVQFENDECKLTAKYDRDLEIVEISKEDKASSWLGALVVSLILGSIIIYAGGYILTLLLLLLRILVDIVYMYLLKLIEFFKK